MQGDSREVPVAVISRFCLWVSEAEVLEPPEGSMGGCESHRERMWRCHVEMVMF